MLDTTTVTRPIDMPILRSNYAWVFGATSTDSLAILRQLDALLTAENVDGYVFQATPYAYGNATRYLAFADSFIAHQPSDIVSDGEGGIDIEWITGNRKVTLSCRSSNAQNDYIYWRENDAYDARDFTPFRLIERLKWLNA